MSFLSVLTLLLKSIHCKYLAIPMRFELTTSSVTGKHAKPLHHGTVFWWSLQDLNLQPTPCKGDALPIELRDRMVEVRSIALLLSACKADVLLLSLNPHLVSGVGVEPTYAKLMRLARCRPTTRDIWFLLQGEAIITHHLASIIAFIQNSLLIFWGEILCFRFLSQTVRGISSDATTLYSGIQTGTQAAASLSPKQTLLTNSKKKSENLRSYFSEYFMTQGN